jgi:hypothetical protein
MPCHCCSIQDADLTVPNEVMCARWCQEVHDEDPEWNCYHQSIEDKAKFDDWMEKLNQMKVQLTVEISQINNISAKIIWQEIVQVKKDKYHSLKRQALWSPALAYKELEIQAL